MSKIILTKNIYVGTGRLEIMSLDFFILSLMFELNNDDIYAFNFRKSSGLPFIEDGGSFKDESISEYERKMIKLSDNFNYSDYIKNNIRSFPCTNTVWDLENASVEVKNNWMEPTSLVDLGNFEYLLTDKESFRKVRTKVKPYLFGLACLDFSPLKLQFKKSVEDIIEDNNKGY